MKFVCILLVLVVSDAAAKCDTYVVGTTWIRRISHSADGEDVLSYQGCKKGCYYNGTYNEDGARTCKPCKELGDEYNCTGNEATCHWTKGGKCVSQTCPNIAKLRGILSTGTQYYVEDNSAKRIEGYQGDVRREKECLEGSSLEKYFNKIYIDDYIANVNKRYDSSCAPAIKCRENATYLTTIQSGNQCDDKIYPYKGDTACRRLPEIIKQKCHWDVDNLRDNIVYIDGTRTTVRNGTSLEECLQRSDLLYDPQCQLDIIVGGCERNTDGNTIYPPLTDENRQRLFGYRTTQEICQHERSLAHQDCDDTYNTTVNTTCRNVVINGGDLVAPVVRGRVVTKASREACHHIYGCMYNKRNGRCSAWSIWAFVLVMAVLVLVVGGILVAVIVGVVVKK